MANLWRISLDDSGDGCKAVFIIAGCLVGNKDAWNDFNKSWRKTLQQPPRIEYFHQKEYAARSGEFLQFYDKQAWPEPTGKEAAKEKTDSAVISHRNIPSPLLCHGSPRSRLFACTKWFRKGQEVPARRPLVLPTPGIGLRYRKKDCRI